MIDHDALFEAAARAIYSGTDLAPKPSERVAKNVIAAVLPLVADERVAAGRPIAHVAAEAGVSRITLANMPIELAEQPIPIRGSGQIQCSDERCHGHRARCLFGRPHQWSTWFENGRLMRTEDTYQCQTCGGVCVGDEPLTIPNVSQAEEGVSR